jgi:hypothetical protein
MKKKIRVVQIFGENYFFVLTRLPTLNEEFTVFEKFRLENNSFLFYSLYQILIEFFSCN